MSDAREQQDTPLGRQPDIEDDGQQTPGPMRIWVDADACPGVVRDLVLRAAHRLGIQTVFVANKTLQVPESPLISTIRVAAGSDAADDYIATHALCGDLVITHDIPLAARLVERDVVVLNPNGTLFSRDNIGERLSVRNFLHDLRSGGTETGGPRPFDARQKQQFADALDRTLTRLRKSRSSRPQAQ